MSRATSPVADAVVRRWRPLVVDLGARHDLAPDLLLAMACQESGGDPCAWRPEPGFLRQYRDGIARIVAQTKEPRYARWWRDDPLVLATSFGLLQTLVVVALERGMPLRYPTSLCDPETSLEAGCRQLRWLINAGAYGGDDPERRLLLRWNGGGDAAYPDEVRAWRTLIRPLLGGAP